MQLRTAPILRKMTAFLAQAVGFRLASVVVILILTLAGAAIAQDAERLAPKTPAGGGVTGNLNPPDSAPGSDGLSDEPLIPELRQIVLVPTPEAVTKVLQPGTEPVAVQVTDLPEPAKLKEQLTPYISKPLSLKSLNEMVRAVILHYRAQKRPVVDVSVPEQDITPGALQLVVREAKVGAVKTEGNKWFRASLLRAQVRLAEGEHISTPALEQDLQWLGRNPFRTVSGIFTPGATPGTTDVIVKVEDRLPLRVYAGYENSGNDATGENRYQAGFNWGNAFLADQLLSYQFSTSDDFSSLTGHSLVWNFALPWRHLVTVIGAMSDSQTDFSLNGQSFASGGESRQLSLRYTVPLTGNARLDHEWSAGFDFKQSNNNLEFGGLQVFDQPTEIAQFLVSYNATLRDAMGATRLDATLFWSPGNLSSKNDDLNFNAARPGAEAAYTYALVRIERALRLPKEWLLVATAQAQFADGNLLASEQLSLGGYDAVRGFEDRLARGDRGFLLNFEVRSPTFPVLSNWLRLPKGRLVGRERMQAVAFLDYGTASLMDALPGEEETVLATSAGIGLRYSIGDLLAVRADYAWQLAQDGFVDDETSRFHLGITVAY